MVDRPGCSRLAFVPAGRFPLTLGQELLNKSSQAVNFGWPGIDRVFKSINLASQFVMAHVGGGLGLFVRKFFQKGFLLICRVQPSYSRISAQ
jgi:hypothetical protein